MDMDSNGPFCLNFDLGFVWDLKNAIWHQPGIKNVQMSCSTQPLYWPKHGSQQINNKPKSEALYSS